MKKKFGNEIDFTIGNMNRNVLQFIIPVFFVYVLQTVYGMVDVLIVSRFAEISDIAAVNSGAQFMESVVSVMGGLSLAVTVLMGQASGKRENAEKEKAVVFASSAVIFIISALFLTIGIGIFAAPIVRFLQVPDESFASAVSYLRICGMGSVIITAYNFYSSIFNGAGDSVTPLKAVIISTVVNLFGDYVTIGLLNMGAKGAAISTVMAQLISVLICIFAYRKNQHMPLIRLSQFRKETVREFIKLGIPFVLQEILISFSFMAILMITNSLGVEKAASVGIAEKISSFTLMIPSSGKKSITVATAQCMGAGMPDRARKITEKVIIGVSVICLLIAVPMFFRGEFFIAMFKADPHLMYQGALYLKAYALNCLLLGLRYGLIGFLNGCGRSKASLAASLVASFIVRIPVAYLMSRAANISLFMIGLSIPISAVAEILICVLAIWKKKLSCPD